VSKPTHAPPAQVVQYLRKSAVSGDLIRPNKRGQSVNALCAILITVGVGVLGSALVYYDFWMRLMEDRVWKLQGQMELLKFLLEKKDAVSKPDDAATSAGSTDAAGVPGL
jgi:hypothetical protein